NCTAAGHPDRRASLNVRVADDGRRVLLTCRSHRCRVEDIVRGVGLRTRDLFADTKGPSALRARRRREDTRDAIMREALAQPWARAQWRYAAADCLRFVDRVRKTATDDERGHRLLALCARLEAEAEHLWSACDDERP